MSSGIGINPHVDSCVRHYMRKTRNTERALAEIELLERMTIGDGSGDDALYRQAAAVLRWRREGR